MFAPGDFLEKVNEYGGLDRPNLFMVMLYPANGNIAPDMNLRFFCKSTSLLGINLTTADYKPQGYGPSIQLPQGLTHEELSCLFILDANNRVLSYFHTWMNKVHNLNNDGLNTSSNGRLPYEIGYLRGNRGYGMTATITKFNPFTKDIVYEVELRDVFPTNIGSVSLNWDEQNTYSTLPVSFSYSGKKFSGINNGTTDGIFNRSRSDISRLAGTGQRSPTINEIVNSN